LETGVNGALMFESLTTLGLQPSRINSIFLPASNQFTNPYPLLGTCTNTKRLRPIQPMWGVGAIITSWNVSSQINLR